MTTSDVLIVGAGLAGLSLAKRLESIGVSWKLIESRDRIGGRILGHVVTGDSVSTNFDLGPTWFWPEQPRLRALLNAEGIDAYGQYDQGLSVLEERRGERSTRAGFASMTGAYRIDGGVDKLTTRLCNSLPRQNLYLSHRACKITYADKRFVTAVKHQSSDMTFECGHLVLALPPRLIADSIGLPASVDSAVIELMRTIPTWMAGHAKILVCYQRPFWREAGLSGDAVSQLGPLVEIHDASPKQGPLFGLFGFVGVPALARSQHKNALLNESLVQLQRLFGRDAAQPVDISLMDWANEKYTAVDRDHHAVGQHPEYGRPASFDTLCDGRLMLGSTEVAQYSGGLLEGALEASEHVFKAIVSSK